MIFKQTGQARTRKFSRTALMGTALALSALMIPEPARANLIYAGNPTVAGGVGNSQVVLSLSSPGSSSNETGAIMPSGCTGDFQGGCSSANNGLRTFASTAVTNAQNVVVYLDAQEPGSDNLITPN